LQLQMHYINLFWRSLALQGWQHQRRKFCGTDIFLSACVQYIHIILMYAVMRYIIYITYILFKGILMWQQLAVWRQKNPELKLQLDVILYRNKFPFLASDVLGFICYADSRRA
jgi:hypothetical protein